MSFFHFQWRLFYLSVGWKFQKNERSHFDTQWKNHIRREGKASTTTTSTILFFCFALHEHLTHECFMVSRLCIVSLLLLCSLLLYVFPSTLNIFQISCLLRWRNVSERHGKMLSYCFLLLSHIELWAFYATVFCLLRLFYNYNLAANGKRQSEQNGWCWVK